MKPTGKDRCIDCANYVEGDICHICEFISKQKTTNADRIRSMTDEELAEAFATACPEVDTVRRCCKYFAKGNLGCRACWLDWLKEEAKDD
jgi:hypothetical protein